MDSAPPRRGFFLPSAGCRPAISTDFQLCTVSDFFTGTPGLIEMGFEFLQDFNFWGLNFPEESQM
jgi:hypothetical protein